MLGRKIFSAFIASICIISILALVTEIITRDHHGATFGEYAILYAIFVVPVVFIYGILTSIISERLSGRFTRFTHLAALAIHVSFGLVFIVFSLFINLYIKQDMTSVGLGYFLLIFGLSGGLFFYVDRIVKYFWDKGDLKHNKEVAGL